MARGRSNWVVTVSFSSSGDETTYGPYTEQQAEREVGRIERYYADEEPDETVHVTAMPLRRFEP